MADELAPWSGPMREALAEAARAWGDTHPNPMVGAVIVEGGEIVARGYHRRAGLPHAEVEALRALGRPPAPGATLVVTLEPCSTHGRTPPCTGAIVASGLRRVVVGAIDPNPAHAGRGLTLLREAGLEVVSGVLAGECARLNLLFNHWVVHRRPLWAAKVATTLDGRLATRTGHSQWITSPAARADWHHWRRLWPAIAVGAGTALADNPRLTARWPGQPEHCPWRLVFDGRARLAPHVGRLHLFTDAHRTRTIVVGRADAPAEAVEQLRATGAAVWLLPPAPDNAWAVEPAALNAAARLLPGIVVEGGAGLFRQLAVAPGFDYLYWYRGWQLLADSEAPVPFVGECPARLADARQLRAPQHRLFFPEAAPADDSVAPPPPDGDLVHGWLNPAPPRP